MNYMNKVFPLIIGITVGVCITVIPRACMNKRERPEPALAGQELPAKGIGLRESVVMERWVWKPLWQLGLSPTGGRQAYVYAFVRH